MRTSNFDAIAASAPLNREASTVRDGSGDLWNPTLPHGHKRWAAPPALVRQSMLTANRDLIGQTIGRLTVIGLLAEETGKWCGQVWVCRCACGYYEGRKVKSLRANRGSSEREPMCFVCDRVEVLRQRASRPNSKRARAASAARLDALAAGVGR